MPSKPANTLLPAQTAPGNAVDALGPEVAAVLREGMALEEKGLLDAKASAAIEARLDAILQAQMRAAGLPQQQPQQPQQAIETPDAHAAHRSAGRPLRHRGTSDRVRIVVALVFAAAFAGLLLEVTLGSGFIWSGGTAYGALGGQLFVVLAPVCAVGLYLHERSTGSIRAQYPTGFVRWVFLYPTMVVFMAGFLISIPWGWAALLGWTFGAPSRVDVRVASVQVHDGRKRNCDQSARLEFKGATARICLDGRLAGAVPAADDTVAVSGRVSRLGLHVQQVHGR